MRRNIRGRTVDPGANLTSQACLHHWLAGDEKALLVFDPLYAHEHYILQTLQWMGTANCFYPAQGMESQSLGDFGSSVVLMYGLNWRVGACFDLNPIAPRPRLGWTRGGLHRHRRHIHRMVVLGLNGQTLCCRKCSTLMALFPDKSILSSLSGTLDNSVFSSEAVSPGELTLACGAAFVALDVVSIGSREAHGFILLHVYSYRCSIRISSSYASHGRLPAQVVVDVDPASPRSSQRSASGKII